MRRWKGNDLLQASSGSVGIRLLLRTRRSRYPFQRDVDRSVSQSLYQEGGGTLSVRGCGDVSEAEVSGLSRGHGGAGAALSGTLAMDAASLEQDAIKFAQLAVQRDQGGRYHEATFYYKVGL